MKRRGVAVGVFALIAVVGLFALSGCGGARAGSQQAAKIPVPPSTVVVPQGTATFTADVTTGKVTVSNLTGPAATRAILTGGAVTFTTSTLLADPQELSRYVLNVNLQNNLGEPINAPFHILFSNFQNLANPNMNQRPNTTVSTVAGTGGTGYVDGGALSAQIKQPTGFCQDPSTGAIYFGTTDGRIRKYLGGVVSTISSGFSLPAGMCVDGQGNLFVADAGKNEIAELSLRNGAVSFILGTGTNASVDGATSLLAGSNKASFSAPVGIVFLGYQSIPLYTITVGQPPVQAGSITLPTLAVVDSGSGKIRYIGLDSAVVTTTYALAYGVTTVATGLTKPTSATLSSSGFMAVANTGANNIQLYDAAAALGSTPSLVPVATLGTGVAGSSDGTGATATLNAPQGVYSVGNALFVADTGNNLIRQLTLNPNGLAQSAGSWTSATLAGLGTTGSVNGLGSVATFTNPTAIATDLNGDLLVGDTGSNEIREITYSNGAFPIQIGSGTGTVPIDPVTLSNPTGYTPGNPAAPYITSQATIPPASSTTLQPWDLIVPNGVKYFQFTVTVEALTSTEAPNSGVSNPGPAVAPGSPSVFIRTYCGGLTASFNNGNLAEGGFGLVAGVTTDAFSDIWIADSANNAIRRIGYALRTDPGTGLPVQINDVVSTIAGTTGVAGSTDGVGSTASLSAPRGVVYGSDGSIYITDSGNNTIRRIYLIPASSPIDPSSASSYTITTIAGTPGPPGYADGPGTTALFSTPMGITTGPLGDLFVTESTGNRVRRISFNGGDPTKSSSYSVSTIAGATTAASPAGAFLDGNGTAVRFSDPRGIVLAPTGDLYVADRLNNRIRRIQVGGTVTTIAGGATGGYGDSQTGTLAKFLNPVGIGVTGSNYLYVTDTGNNLVRRVSLAGTVETVAGTGIAGSPDGPGNTGQFSSALGMLTVLPSGDIVLGDNTRVRIVERIITAGGA